MGWPEEPFEEMDSTLAVQMYIQQLVRKDPSNVELILTIPENQDEGVWKYEHLRQFCMELNGLAVRLQSQCFPNTCNQMTATEQWIFLCAGKLRVMVQRTLNQSLTCLIFSSQNTERMSSYRLYKTHIRWCCLFT